MRDEVGRLQATGNAKYFGLYESNGKQEITGLNFHEEWVIDRPTADKWKIVASLEP